MAIMRLEGLGQIKNPMTSGIEPGTLQIAKGLKGSDHDLIEILCRHLLEGAESKTQSIVPKG
jgi:hypothetical protein